MYSQVDEDGRSKGVSVYSHREWIKRESGVDVLQVPKQVSGSMEHRIPRLMFAFFPPLLEARNYQKRKILSRTPVWQAGQFQLGLWPPLTPNLAAKKIATTLPFPRPAIRPFE